MPDKPFSTVTYQGLPCAEGTFSVTPGMTPDNGSVLIYVQNPEKMKLETLRPMNRFNEPPRVEPAKFAMIGSAIDGASLTLYAVGTLVLGDMKIEQVWVRDEGVVEESSFLTEDGTTKISRVRIHLCDPRIWGGRRGFVFGTFNKLGVDGKHIASTGVPGTSDGRAFTLEEVIDVGLAALPFPNERGTIEGSVATNDFRPVNKEPRFQNPIDFLTDLLADVKLLFCRQIDGTVDFYEHGSGQNPDTQFIPKDLLLVDRCILGHDYSPDSTLLYAQYPTMEEVEVEFDGASCMVLPDPRDGKFKFWLDMLPYYGFTEEAFKKQPLLENRGVEVALKFTRAYTKRMRADDAIPTFMARQGRNAAAAEAIRRANLINEHAFKAFQLPAAKMNLLPFEETLVSSDENGPLSPRIRIQSFRFRDRTDEQATSFGVKIPRRYWANAAEPFELQSDNGEFTIQSRTGMIFFHRGPQGFVYGKDEKGKRIDPPLDTDTRIVVPGAFELPAQSMYLEPPGKIFLLVARTHRGLRDLRSYPGRRSKFPPAAAAIQLQERSSPEDHFMAAFDVNGKKMDVDEADKLFPEVHQMYGARRMTSIQDGIATGIRDEKLVEEAERTIKPLLAKAPSLRGRHRKGYGIYPVKVDGVVTQVVWSVDADGVPTTEILTGCLRTSISPSTLSVMDKQTQVQATREPQGSSSPTNLGRMPS